MYFTTDELIASLPLAAQKKPEAWIRKNLGLISEMLGAHRFAYRSFGPYWWGLKRLLKQELGSFTHVWFRGSYTDEEVRAAANHGSDVLNLHAALSYQATQKTEIEWLERDESMWHILEWPSGKVDLFRLSDIDAAQQMDLFDEIDQRSLKLDRYLNSIVEFLPRTWRMHGDKALRAEQPDHAAYCYRRMTLLAGNSMDRTEGWLLQGMAFDHKGHHRKAIFCYTNLYEKGKHHWVLGNIAASYFMAADYRKAVESYAQALQHMPGNPEFEAGLRQARQKIESQTVLLDVLSA